MSIALSLGNNLTTGGIFKPTAVNNTSVNNVTDFASITGDATLVLLSTQTASASANISFTSGIDSTYDEYIFKFISCHPASQAFLGFNFSTDGGSNYNAVKTSTNFRAYHSEADTDLFSYSSGDDIAQGTGLVLTAGNLGNASDETSSVKCFCFHHLIQLLLSILYLDHLPYNLLQQHLIVTLQDM
jgi:hypothetical protein